MDEQLRELKAPKRSKDVEQATFLELQREVKKYNAKSKLTISFISICAVALLFILLFPTNNFNFKLTQATTGEVESVEIYPYIEFEKKNFFGRGVYLSGDKLKVFRTLVEQTNSSKNSFEEPYIDDFNEYFNVKYSNDLEEMFIVAKMISKENESPYLLINNNSGNYITLTLDEYVQFRNLYPYGAHPIQSIMDINPFELLIKLLLILLVYSGYLVLAKKASPNARQPLKDEFTIKNMILKFLFLIPLIWVIGYLTFEFYGYYNWREAFLWIILVFLLRKFKEYLDGNSRRKWREIPLSILFYFMCYVIYFF